MLKEEEDDTFISHINAVMYREICCLRLTHPLPASSGDQIQISAFGRDWILLTLEYMFLSLCHHTSNVETCFDVLLIFVTFEYTATVDFPLHFQGGGIILLCETPDWFCELENVTSTSRFLSCFFCTLPLAHTFVAFL